MLIVPVHVRVRSGQVEDFLAATLANARAFPAGGDGWTSGAP